MSWPDDSITVYDIDNPFPLGIPERVIKQWEREGLSVLAPAPATVFKADLDSVAESDLNGISDRIFEFMQVRDAPRYLMGVLMKELYSLPVRTVRSITVCFTHERGWQCLLEHRS